MYARLVLKNVTRHWLRSLLTVLSLAVAVFLICLLNSARTSMTAAVDMASSKRLFVQSAVSLFVDLPLAYQQKLQPIEGIERICKWQWFGGRYEQDKGGFFAQFGVDPETFLPSYPEISIVDGSYDQFKATKTGCVVGKDTADKYGWQVGQTVPITGRIFQRTDDRPWEFTLCAIYVSNKASVDQQTMYFHFDYLRESLEQGGASGPEGCGLYLLQLQDGADGVRVANEVDALFANGPQRVQTTTEAEFARQFASFLGNVPLLLQMIGGAVLFAIFFAVLNTMLMAARERTRDQGILQALGFPQRILLLLFVAESLLLAALGAGTGITLLLVTEEGFQKAIGARLQGFTFDGGSMRLGSLLALAIGLVAGLLPGIRLGRQRVVEALREVG